MAEYTVTIDGDRQEELSDIIARVHVEQPGSTITAAEYVRNLIVGHLDERIRNAYLTSVRDKTVAELRAILGPRKGLQ